MLPASSPDLYLDMQQFAQLKRGAQARDGAATRAAAIQFEGLFLQMMLKDMRAAARFDEAQHSSTLDFYHEMHDRQLAQNLARSGGLGIARMLEAQLQSGTGEGAVERHQTASAGGNSLPEYRLPVSRLNSKPLPSMNYAAQNPAVKLRALNETASPVPGGGALSVESARAGDFKGWDGAASFVRDLWPHAQDAARQLGVSAELLVAQSALETGWGQRTIKRGDGSVAFSLFGIKAGADWNGERVSRSTLEYRGGAMQREQAQFRAYGSISESVYDYVQFVKTRAHYSEALLHGGSDEHYIRELQRGGYATDPAYPQKVLNLVSGVKLAAVQPETIAQGPMKEGSHV